MSKAGEREAEQSRPLMTPDPQRPTYELRCINDRCKQFGKSQEWLPPTVPRYCKCGGPLILFPPRRKAA